MGCSCSKDLLVESQQPESSSDKEARNKQGDSVIKKTKREGDVDGVGNASHEPFGPAKEGSLPLHHQRSEGSSSALSATPTRSSSAKEGQGSSMTSSTRSSPPTGRGTRGSRSPSTPATVVGEEEDDDDDGEHNAPDDRDTEASSDRQRKDRKGRRQGGQAQPQQKQEQREATTNENDPVDEGASVGGTTTAATSLGGGTTAAASGAYLLEDPSEHYESDAENQRFSQVKDDIQQDLKHLFDLEEEVKLESRQLIHDIDNSTSSHLDDAESALRGPKSVARSPPPVVNVLFTGDDAGYLMNLLRLTNGPAFTQNERSAFRDAIRSNVVEDVRVLCRNLRASDFESFLVYHEDELAQKQREKEQQPPPDLFDTLQLFGQLKNAWQDIRAHGLASTSTTEVEEPKGADQLKAREAFEILVSMLLGDEDDEGDDPTKENVDLYEEERESIEDTKLFLNLWREIQVLWQSDELKEFLSERPWLLHDSLLFHLSIMEDLARIAAPDYSVTDEDILDASPSVDASTCEHCNVSFENVIFSVTCLSLSYVDQFGLQGAERPHILAFVASLTGFDQTQGDEGVNKMMRSIGSLRTLCSIDEVQRECVTCVILTKQDLFAEKMRYSDVAAIADFEDFEGESGDADGAFDYFIDKFQNCLVRKSDEFVVPFDAEENDVGDVLHNFARRLPVVAAQRVAAPLAVVAAQNEPKAMTLADDPPIPTPAIEVTCTPDDDEFYTETIEV